MKAKRLIAVVMAFLLIFGNAFSVNAVGIIGEMITDISGMNRLTISAALNDYFNSREAFLLNQSDTINVPLVGVIEDEAAHRQKYVTEEIVFVDSSISIGDIVSSDTQADAEVTETISYTKDGVTNTATVAHKLFLFVNDDNVPVVVSDRYFEEFSGFQSCSYVDESVAFDINAVGGSGSCIAQVAWNEIGTTEDANGCTEYGEWYGQPNWAWCAIFVSWCANEANIATSIIPKTADPYALKNSTTFYSPSNATGTNAPKSGDLIFFSWDGTGIAHVGIVHSITASNDILIVNGNNSANAVAYRCVSPTDAQIVGYGKPAYASSGHTNKSSRDFNTTQHWFSCANCGLEGAREAHTIKTFHDYDDKEHWFGCVGCSHAVAKEPHSLTYVSLINQHKGSCDTCGYIGSWEAHQIGDYEVSATHHWKVCNSCNMQVDKEKHLFDEVLYGRVYMCVDCGYETDMPHDVIIDEEVS